jgi:hypothetical protein
VRAGSKDLDAKVAQLVDMGFVSRMAYEALRRTDGDVDRAIDLLTSGRCARGQPLLLSPHASMAC